MNAVRTRPARPIQGVTYPPADEARHWLEAGAWDDATLGSRLRSTARLHASRTAYVCEGRRLRFDELDAQSDRVAAGLLERGLQAGDRAFFQMGTTIETAVALFGCFKAGVLPVCTIAAYRTLEMEALARITRPSAFFVQADVAPGFDQIGFASSVCRAHGIVHLFVARGAAPEGAHSLDAMAAAALDVAPVPEACTPCDVAALQLSGGSTGVPKVIPRHHGEYLGHTRAWCDRFGTDETTTGIWALPMLHNAGMMFSVLRAAIYGATTVLMPRFDPRGFLELVERERVQHAFTIGPHAPAIAGYPGVADHDLSSLRITSTLIGAESIEASTGRPATNMFGITEGLVLTGHAGLSSAIRHGSIGAPCSAHDTIRILEPGSEREMPFGEAGELCFKGPSSLRGYLGAPAETRESLSADGFFRTADRVRASRIDGQVVYHFEGRIRDNINRGGEKFGTEDIERLLARHPAIADGKVVAMPDPIYGERACAFLIPRAGAALPSIAELGAHLVAEGLAKFKCPERIEAIDAFPVTRVGKLDRQALRQRIAERLQAERSDEPAPEAR